MRAIENLPRLIIILRVLVNVKRLNKGFTNFTHKKSTSGQNIFKENFFCCNVN